MSCDTVQPDPDGSRIRLLIVVNVAWFFLSHRLPLAVGARAAGYDVHVAVGDATREQISVLTSHGLIYHPLVLRRASRSPLANGALFISLVRLYRQLDPHIVHHVTVKPVLFGTLAARLVGVPAVVNAISGLGYMFIGGGLVRRTLRALASVAYRVCLRHRNTMTIFQNEDDRREFGRIARIGPQRSLMQAGSGVDLSRFTVRAEPPAPPVRVLLPARMLKDKGVVEFARAIGRLRESGVEIEGLLAGPIDSENPAGLTEIEVRELERTCGVRWLGNVSDIASLMSDVHIVCLPSYREGLPKALAEAAAAGRALVTTDVPGCRAVVDDGRNGILVPPATVDPLARALQRLAVEPELRRAFARAARERAELEFDVRQVVARTLDVYARLLASVPASELRAGGWN